MTNKAGDNTASYPPISRAKRWLKDAVWMLIFFMVISVGVDIWRSQDMPTDTIPTPVMQSTLGNNINLIERSHEAPVMVYFWGSWCSVCRFVTPTINWLDDSYDVVSIAVSSGNNRRVRGYLKHHDYMFETINDNNSSIMKAWGVSAVPTVAIISNGQVQSITTGFSTPLGLWLRMQVARFQGN